MRSMTPDELLDFFKERGVAAAHELQKQRKETRDARDAREILSATTKALAAASAQGRTDEGRRTFQTLLTAAASRGMDSQRYRPNARPSSSAFTATTWRTPASAFARLRPDLAPMEAMHEGAYWFEPRSKRSDAVTPPACP